MRFAVSYRRGDRFAVQGTAEVTFLVQARDADGAESAAAELYTVAYGRAPADDLAELISVQIVA
jgi:hypothetical protein